MFNIIAVVGDPPVPLRGIFEMPARAGKKLL
jgi:hypothetical protein